MSFMVFPAVDVLQGQCVRLRKGCEGTRTVYYADPVDAARRWEAEGAEALHVVDLDAALGNVKTNTDIIGRLVGSVSIPVQAGGGLRSKEAVKMAFDMGVWRVVLGTAALKPTGLLEWALDRYADRVLVALDTRNGRVVVSGWTEEHTEVLSDTAKGLLDKGVQEVLATGVDGDGMMEGPDLEPLRVLISVGMRVIASGGVATLEDIRAVKSLGHLVRGVVVGRAFYEGVMTLREANATGGRPGESQTGR